jgi:small subunit ribosomal protein S20
MAEEKKQEEAAVKTKRPSAQKRDIQNLKRRTRNRSMKAEAKTALRALELSIEKKQKAAAEKLLRTLFALVDKGTKKGLFKLNKASRIKARFAEKLASL